MKIGPVMYGGITGRRSRGVIPGRTAAVTSVRGAAVLGPGSCGRTPASSLQQADRSGLKQPVYELLLYLG